MKIKEVYLENLREQPITILQYFSHLGTLMVHIGEVSPNMMVLSIPY